EVRAMKRKCAFCEKSRLTFVWLVALAILINAASNLVYHRDTLTVFEILKIPLVFCVLAFLVKFLKRNK
ncbi:hypothetical protein OAV54_02550, partial [Planktomarina temperata]|nr:hypothetical protein [Planktomarina temperata]